MNNSPYCLSYNFYGDNLEKLVLGQLIIRLNYIFPILISCSFDIVLKS